MGGSDRQNQGLPCSASVSWWGHWVTPSLTQCTRGGLLPTVERAPWEGQARLQRNGMGRTSPNELLSHLALRPFSPSSNWSLLDHESGERVSPDVLESRAVLAFPTMRELRPQMLRAQMHYVLGRAPMCPPAWAFYVWGTFVMPPPSWALETDMAILSRCRSYRFFSKADPRLES